MMDTNNAADSSVSVIAAEAFRGGGSATEWAGVSNQQRTTLHFVNDTVTNSSYLNNIINPVIVAPYEQYRLDSHLH